MKLFNQFIVCLFLMTTATAFAQEDVTYKISFDADPLIKQINGRELTGEAQVRVVLSGNGGEVVGGKLASGILPNITIDEEEDIGKVRNVEITLNGREWTKSVTIREITVRKITEDDSKKYTFSCGCQLTQGNEMVFMDAGGAVGFVEDEEALRKEELDEFEFDGDFQDGDVYLANFTVSKRNTGTSTKPKGTKRVVKKTKTRICTTQDIEANGSFDINFITNPTQNAIYPGALIYAESLADGSYKNIKTGKDRSPITISTSSAVIGVPLLEVNNPSLATIRGAMNDIMINQERGDLDVQANFEIFEVNSKEELSIALGGHFDSATANMNASFNYDTNSERSMKVVKFAQIYYSMDVDQPSSPEDVFVNPKDAIEVMESGSTPLYVSQVTFGRIAYFFMDTSLSTSEIQAHVDGEYTGSFTAGAEADFRTSMEKDQTKISALIIGGDSSGGITAVDGYDGFISMLREGGTLSKQSLGVPVSYTLRYLSDNSIARVNLATSYVKRTCKEVDDPIISVRARGISIKGQGTTSSEQPNDIHGTYTITVTDLKNKKRVFTEGFTIAVEDHPLIFKSTGFTEKLDKYSKSFNIDSRRLDDYEVKVDIAITEHDDWDEEDEHVWKSGRYRLKDVMSLQKGGAPKEKTLTINIDEETYWFSFNAELLD